MLAGSQLFASSSVTRASLPHSMILKDTGGTCHFSLPFLSGSRLSNHLLQHPKLRIPKEHTLPLPPPLPPPCGALKISKDLLDAHIVQALEITERLFSCPCSHDLVIFYHELILCGGGGYLVCTFLNLTLAPLGSDTRSFAVATGYRSYEAQRHRNELWLCSRQSFVDSPPLPRRPTGSCGSRSLPRLCAPTTSSRPPPAVLSQVYCTQRP